MEIVIYENGIDRLVTSGARTIQFGFDRKIEIAGWQNKKQQVYENFPFSLISIKNIFGKLHYF